MNDAEQICARLIATGTLLRDDVRDLEHPQIRADVEARLNACGLSLATSAYSEYYGLRLRPETADATVLDAPSNLDLKSDACALLTVLWARLALQRRTAEDTQQAPDAQASLLQEHQGEKARTFTPSVRFETIAHEFGSRLGGRTRLKVLLGQLRRLGFITYHHLDDIQAGPLLELGIDGEKMVSFIRLRVLGELLKHAEPSAADSERPSTQAQTAAESLRIGASGMVAPAKRAAGVS